MPRRLQTRPTSVSSSGVAAAAMSNFTATPYKQNPTRIQRSVFTKNLDVAVKARLNPLTVKALFGFGQGVSIVSSTTGGHS